MEVNVKPGSRAAVIYKNTRATERYYCNFGLNPAYQEQLQRAGIEISGADEAGEARIMELPEHPFFIGTLFVPQANSTKDHPHPIVVEFVRASATRLDRALVVSRTISAGEKKGQRAHGSVPSSRHAVSE